MDIFALNACCGVGEVEYLEDACGPDKALQEIGNLMFEDPDYSHVPTFAHLIFTEVTKRLDGRRTIDTKTYGADLAKLIKKQKLGTVLITRMAVNPCHNDKDDKHMLKTYLWTPNYRKFKAYWKANGGVVQKRERDDYFW